MDSPSRYLAHQLIFGKKVKGQGHRITQYKKDIEWPSLYRPQFKNNADIACHTMMQLQLSLNSKIHVTYSLTFRHYRIEVGHNVAFFDAKNCGRPICIDIYM